MKPNNKYRNNYCGSLTEENIGETVKLSGWIENIRDHGGVIFVDVRDEKGTIQTVTNDEKLFDGLTRESTICLTGKVRKRNEEDYNARISTGTIEVLVDSLEVLGAAKNVLPFEVMTSTEVNEETRLKYRYLDLRNKKVHDNILFRTKVISYLREKMNSLEFTEIQTPILTASSPEGARDFIVPSRKYHGKFYALPQAPQIFKQLLMVSGFDKYFQVAPCFRDEDARKDRVYGEFYQLDMEMCFAEQEDIYALGKADIAMAGITVTDERMAVMSFSDSYATGIQSVIVPEGSDIASVDDLAGKKIGTQRGTTGYLYCSDDFGEDAVVAYDNGLTAVQALNNGQVDAVVIDNEPAKAYVESNPGLKILDTSYAEEDYAIGMNKSNTALLEAVNAALEELKADGTLQAIVDKYIKAE